MLPKLGSKSQRNIGSPSKIINYIERRKQNNDLGNYGKKRSPAKQDNKNSKDWQKINPQLIIFSQLKQKSQLKRSLSSSLISQKKEELEVFKIRKSGFILGSESKQKFQNQEQIDLHKKIELLIDKLQQLYPEVSSQITKFYQSIQTFGLSSFYIYYLIKSYVRKVKVSILKQGFPSFKLVEEMQQQIVKTKNRQIYFFKIALTWQTRANLLDRFSSIVKEKIYNQSQVQPAKQIILDNIKSLRMLTFHLVDLIIKWRQQIHLQSNAYINDLAKDQYSSNKWMFLPERAIFFVDSVHNKENMLLRILNDNNFVLKSPISKCLDMGTKNDPFLISALTKIEENSKSEYLQIFEITQQEKERYKKVMQYLANEKAFDIRSKQKKKIKRNKSNIERIYLSQKNRLDKSRNGVEEKSIEIQKQSSNKEKLQRIQKNAKRIQLIKAAYDKNRSPLVNNGEQSVEVTEEELQASDQENKGKVQSSFLDEEFEKRVKQQFKVLNKIWSKFYKPKNDQIFEERMKAEKKTIILEKEKEKQQKSKDEKEGKDVKEKGKQQQMLKNVKNLNKELKNKLQQLTKEANQSEARSKNLLLKSSDEIMEEVKKEILQKIEKEEEEKQRLRRKRKQEQEKALDQIKEKIKKQFEEKLALQRKEKLEVQSKLEKQLQEQGDRMKEQLQISIKMQNKSAKQKEVKQKEKKKRQGRERELKAIQQEYFKEKQKQQEAKSKDEKLVQRLNEENKAEQAQIKEKLLKELKQAEAHQNINIRKTSKQQASMNIANASRTDLDISLNEQVKNGKDEEDKGIERAKDMQEESKRARAAKQAEIRKQIELIKSREEKELTLLEKQNEIRHRMLKYKKGQQIESDKKIEELIRKKITFDKDDPNSNSEIRDIKYSKSQDYDKYSSIQQKIKIQEEDQKRKQNEIQKVRKQRELEQSILRAKIKERIEKQLNEEAVKRMKKHLDETQEKEYMKKKSEGQKERSQLFKQFHKPSLPQYSELHSQFMLKQLSQQNAKTSLRSQFEQQLLASYLPSRFYSLKHDLKVKNFQPIGDDQYLNQKMEVNRKQMERIKEIEHSPLEKSQVKQHIYELTEEQKYIYKKQKNRNREWMENEKQSNRKEEKELKGKQTRKKQNQYEPMSIKRSEEKMQLVKNQKIKKDSEDEAGERKKKKREGNEERKISLDQKQVDSEDGYKAKRNKMEGKKQHQTSQMGHSQPKQSTQLPKIQKIKYKKLEKALNLKFHLQFQSVPEGELDHHLEIHFSRVPIEQSSLFPFNRQQLYRKLINQLTFSIILGSYENKMAGTAYAYHDRFSNSQSRRFIIPHISTYNTSHLKQFILDNCDYIFLKDPCDEIEFKYIFNESIEEQKRLSDQLCRWWDSHGPLYQKKIGEDLYERKFVYRRQYFHKCQIQITALNKSMFRNILNIESSILVTQQKLPQRKDSFENEQSSLPLNKSINYTLFLAQLFRIFMEPEEAEKLKSKISSNPYYREILGLIISLQRKKVKVQEYDFIQISTISELNMRLMSQGKQYIRYVDDRTGKSEQRNEIFYGQLSSKNTVLSSFQTTVLPITQASGTDTKYNSAVKRVRHINYFRLNPLSGHNFHSLRSSIYNSQLYIIPTQSNKCKIFVMSGEQFIEIVEKQKIESVSSPISLSSYIKLFLQNVSKHKQISTSNFIWVPQIVTNSKVQKINEFKEFYGRQIYIQDLLNMNYKQFVPSGLLIKPEHRDIVIGAPLIIGVMSMSVEKIVEGYPLFARVCEMKDLKTIQLDYD